MKRVIILIASIFISFTAISQELHIYGGKSHDVYLGCLNCNSSNSNSIWNNYGTYGSKYNNKSIWNSYGTYGGSYSDFSPFNTYAGYPPVVVDNQGNFYGYLTINSYKDKKAEFDLALTIYKYYDLIQDDVPAWYDKIFN